MEIDFTKYNHFVEHPRYGRNPIITGLDPSPLDDNVHLHWNATTHQELSIRYENAVGVPWTHEGLFASVQANKRIPNTAVIAYPAKQTRATVPVTHYFDLERSCRDCQRPFIFFAAEQKYWYEELGFVLDADAVRCIECRKKQQGIARLRKRYQALHAIEPKSNSELRELAECCSQLVDWGVFKPQRLEFARMLLNRAEREL